MANLSHAQTIVAALGLVSLLTLESWLPFRKGRRKRFRHGLRNISLGAMNAVVMALVAPPLFVHLTTWAERSDVGLLRLIDLPVVVSMLLAVLLLDGWMYLWHLANHRLPLLWRFHRVHHSDQALDVTTAVRFHTGEILISTALRLAVVPLIGVSLWQLLFYDVILLPVIQFHHSNVRLPERWDKWLRLLIASPTMHRVHHSRLRVETDSNYSSIFSFWDRLGRTFRWRHDVDVHYGLEGYDGDKWQRIRGLLHTPFTASASEVMPSQTPLQKRKITGQLNIHP
jgi:sterol desaturase/sphingolipid hydroxylase (fatty acid hydroxylase superfamily)